MKLLSCSSRRACHSTIIRELLHLLHLFLESCKTWLNLVHRHRAFKNQLVKPPTPPLTAHPPLRRQPLCLLQLQHELLRGRAVILSHSIVFSRSSARSSLLCQCSRLRISPRVYKRATPDRLFRQGEPSHQTRLINRKATNSQITIDLTMADAVEDPCAASFDDSHNGLRIASIFIILVSG